MYIIIHENKGKRAFYIVFSLFITFATIHDLNYNRCSKFFKEEYECQNVITVLMKKQ